MAAMKATGFKTQSGLAKASGVEQSSISKIIRGVSETSKASGKLAEALGVNSDWLITGRGEMFGATDGFEKKDASRVVDLYDSKGFTGDKLNWFNEIPKSCVAYNIKFKTGIKQIPGGTYVIADTQKKPENDDLVITCINGEISVFRYLFNGVGSFLSVDDERIPLAELKDLSSILGVITQVYIPSLNK